MITFLLGRPGSGKSYYAVDKIFNNFSISPNAKKDKKFKYDICYTNINEFNFDKVKNVYPLDFTLLKEHLGELHRLYKSKATDEELIEKCREFNLLNALFVIDEAHNFFATRSTVLVWWLSYHRHIFHEIILITQNLALIETKYKSFSEFFYEARPASLTLDKRFFYYSVFCSSRLNSASKSGVVKVKRSSEVFELYQSGDSINTSNVILKILFGAFVFLILAIVIFSYFTHSLTSSNEKKTDSSSSQTQKITYPTSLTQHVISPTSLSVSSTQEYTEKRFFVLNCSSSICVNDVISIPPQLLKKFINTKDITSLYVYPLSKSFTRYYLQSSQDFYTFLSQTKGFNNDLQIPDNSLLGSPVPVPTR